MPECSQHPARNVSKEISDAVVALVRQVTGRGPIGARTTVDRDLVYVFLRGSLTRGETSLVDEGLEEEVLALRRAFQSAMRRDITEIVERLCGRRVEAFMSANHIDPDCAVEIFLLGARVDAERPAPVGKTA